MTITWEENKRLANIKNMVLILPMPRRFFPATPSYQTLINETLKQAITHSDIESTLRKVIREELKKTA